MTAAGGDPSTPYADIDAILFPWARSRALRVVTEFKGYEVRSVQLYSRAGEMLGHMWLDRPENAQRVSIHAAISDQKSIAGTAGTFVRIVDRMDLLAALNEMWDLLISEASGHSLL
jgi:hypothetical protein